MMEGRAQLERAFHRGLLLGEAGAVGVDNCRWEERGHDKTLRT